MPTANTPQNVHIDRRLTNLSVNFVQGNERFVSDKVFPVVPVTQASDKYVVFDRADLWRDNMKVRPMGGRPAQLRWRFSDDSYSVEEFAVEYMRDDRIVRNQDAPIAGDEQAMKVLQSQAQVHADIDWATAYFGTSIWTTENAPTTKWDAAGSDPISDLQTEMDTVDGLTGYLPNVAVFGVDAWRVFRNHTQVLDRIKHTQPGFITEAIAARAIGVDRVLVFRAIKTTSVEGAATDTFARIGNVESVLLAYAAPNPGIDVPTAGYTFAWTGLEPGFTNVLGGVIERGRDPRAHSDWFQIRQATDMKLVSADLGAFVPDTLT